MWVILLTLFFILMLFLAIAISHAGAVADRRLEEYYEQLKGQNNGNLHRPDENAFRETQGHETD